MTDRDAGKRALAALDRFDIEGEVIEDLRAWVGAVGEVIEVARREQMDCYCQNDNSEDCPCDWCVMDRALANLDKEKTDAEA